MSDYEDNYFTLGDMTSKDPADVSLYNVATTAEDISKSERLEQEKQRKLEKLASVNQGESLDRNSYSVLEDGAVVSNANKIFNDLSGNDYQNLLRYAQENYSLTPGEDGSLAYGSGDSYAGDTRRLYGFYTKDNTNTAYKAGVARGDLPGAEGRYIPDGMIKDYGWEPGELGVDVSQKDSDILYPHQVATMLEGVGHGRKEALANRVVKDKSLDPFTADSYGSGYTEYYTSKADFLGTPSEEYDAARGKELFDQYLSLTQSKNPRRTLVDPENYQQSLKEEALRYAAENAGVTDRLGNAIDAFQRTLTKEAIVDFGDWVGEGLDSVTGGKVGWDLGTEEEKTAWVNETFGFNPYMAEADYAEAKKYADNITDAIYSDDKEVDFGDVYNLVKTGITTPEMLGDIVGFIGSFFVPLLGWGGKAAKADKAIRGVQAAVKAGKMTKDAAKVAVQTIKQDVTVLNKVRQLAQQNAALAQVSAGNVNDQIDAYREEFGEAPSVGKVAQMMATETIMLGLDRWTDLSILKAPAALKGVREAFTALPKTNKAKILAKTVGAAAGLTANMGKEAGQEYLQELGQQFNVKFNFDDNGEFLSAETLDEAKEVLLDKEMQASGIMGAGLGAGGAVQFAAAGTILPTASKVVSGTATGLGKVKDALLASEAPAATVTPESRESELEVAKEVEANVQQAASSTNPASAYFAAQGSNNIETRSAASTQAAEVKESVLNGTNTVFNSDEDLSSKLNQLQPLVEIIVAEDPEVTTYEILTALNKQLNPKTEEETAQVEETVKAAHASGLEFASIKPLLEVSADVSTGTKGFVTYYTRAKAALAEGNTEEYDRVIGKLDNFYGYQQTKLDRLTAGIDNVRRTIEGQVDILVKQGKAKSRKEALSMLSDDFKERKYTVRNSDNNSATTEIKFGHVVAKMQNPNFDKGIYRLVGTVSNEVAAMGKAYNQLLGGTTEAETVAAPEVEATQTPTVDQVLEETAVEETPMEAPRQFSEAEMDEATIIPEDYDTLAAMDEATQIDEFTAPPAMDLTEEDISISPEEDISVTEENITVEPEKAINTKDATVSEYNINKAALKDVKKRIATRRGELRAQGIKGKAQLEDEALVALLEEKQQIDNVKESFVTVLKDKLSKRLEKFTTKVAPSLPLFKSYPSKEVIKVTIAELFKDMVPTGYTLSERTKDKVVPVTKKFGDKLLKAFNVKDGKFDVRYGQEAANNPITLFLFDENGSLNYNTVEAMQSATYEFLNQDVGNLRGASRTNEEIGELFNIPEEYVTVEMSKALRKGGMTVKLAAAAVGEKVIKNLGLRIENTQHREALASSFGIAALKGLEGDFIRRYDYIPTEEERARKSHALKAKSIPMIIGNPEIFDKMYEVRLTIDMFEETLGVEIDKERTYRTTRKATSEQMDVHRAAYQEVPKDHQDVVNRLQNTAFKFNSGNDVLLEMFSTEENVLDVEALIEHILGDVNDITNKDTLDRYNAQKEAVIRSLAGYTRAIENDKENNIFFDWFIAKNHRIHLDSNTINPQNDKHIARWLLTAANSTNQLSKADIQALLNGKEASKDAKMFAYAIVQAFDGAKGIPGIDKDNEKEVIASAKELLENTTADELMEMAMASAHVGHAALAIANIRKYMDAIDVIESDMVLEVDGLTNGFAFRSMQFPVDTNGSPISSKEWLEKVGFVAEGSDMYELESMNGARTEGQEDVYISVGAVFNEKIAVQKDQLAESSAKWIKLFEKHNRLPDFSADTADVKKFIRNLMKSPVMIFNYAAHQNNIAIGLVDDQVMGTGYLSGRGLIDLLTEKEGKGYTVTQKELVDTFGDVLGNKYHKARMALDKKNLDDNSDQNLILLKQGMYRAVEQLYTDPLVETLETLFSKQTEVNTAFTHAAQFMYEHFNEQYTRWRAENPNATDEDKLNYLKDMASIIPGVAGASSDDQLNKVTFLKNALDPTNNEVTVTIAGERTSTNTVSRGFGAPGVGPAVLTVLSLDSSVLAKTLNQAYKNQDGAGALPIHDAMVLGTSEFDTISSYNLNFYTVNRNYSIAQEFVSAIENFEATVSGARTKSIRTVNNKVVSFGVMKKLLTKVNNEVQKGRKNLFNQNVKVGQMVGPEGSMAQIDVKSTKEAATKALAASSSMILNRFEQKRIKDALGKEYTSALSKLKKMLEGCK